MPKRNRSDMKSAIFTDSYRDDLYHLEIDTGTDGYGFTATFPILLNDVKQEFGIDMLKEVEAWASSSQEGDVFSRRGILITNLGKE